MLKKYATKIIQSLASNNNDIILDDNSPHSNQMEKTKSKFLNSQIEKPIISQTQSYFNANPSQSTYLRGTPDMIIEAG